MDISRMRYFVAVAEELHFGRAAQRLHLTTPALSQQIRRLEAELGLSLLVRDSRRVALTPAGADLLPVVRSALSSVDEVAVTARRLSGSLPLRVGHLADTDVLLPALARLERQSPKLRVEETVHAAPGRLADAVLVGELDAAVTFLHAVPSGLTVDLARLSRARVVTRSCADGPVATSGSEEVAWRPWQRWTESLERELAWSLRRVAAAGGPGQALQRRVDEALRVGPLLTVDGFHPLLALPGVREVEQARVPVLAWSLVTRAGEQRSGVLALRAALHLEARRRGWFDVPAGAWLPASDPHHALVA